MWDHLKFAYGNEHTMLMKKLLQAGKPKRQHDHDIKEHLNYGDGMQKVYKNYLEK